jgi:hypothetical protein
MVVMAQKKSSGMAGRTGMRKIHEELNEPSRISTETVRREFNQRPFNLAPEGCAFPRFKLSLPGKCD